MAHISDPIDLGSLTVPNRIVRSSTAECMCDPDGKVTEQLLALYRRLSGSGAGLIITGGAAVHPTGHTYPGVIGAEHDHFIPGLTRLAEAIKSGGSRAVLQIYHCGRQQAPGTGDPVAPSPVPDRMVGTSPRALLEHEIEDIIAGFARAAARARAAGFDGIQLAACNGHLIGQFLSPYTNRRTDGWGGDRKRRRRFFVETMRSVREAVGADYPILVKLGVHDFVRGGLKPDEALAAAAACAQDLAAVEITAGIYESTFFMSRGQVPTATIMAMPEVRSRSLPARIMVRLLLWSLARRARFADAYLLPFARAARARLTIPIITVGGIRSRPVIDSILSSGAADMVAISRPFIAEPHLGHRLLADPDAAARCRFCNECLIGISRGVALRCYGGGS